VTSAGRPFSRAVVAGTAAHHGYELAVGGGVPGMSVAGLRGAAGGWTAALAGWCWLTGRRTHRAERGLAGLNGFCLAAVTAHYVGWRWQVVHGVAMVRAHWLPVRVLPGYNVLLVGLGVCAALAVHRETPPELLPRALLTAAGLTPGMVVLARAEGRWLQRQARREPAWWNRAFRS
jgi:hypothetical protein